MDFNTFIEANDLGNVDNGVSFKSLTTIGTGGLIKHVYYPKNIDSLARAYKFIIDNNLKHLIIGNGSNILARDNFYDGIIICVKKMPSYLKINDDYIIASAFYPTIKLAYDLAEKRLGDLSFLGGIPGLLGGAIYNNSGAYNDNISNHILNVKYIDTAGKIIEINNEECAFGYRKSRFHFIEGIIIEAKLNISHIETMDILEKRRRARQMSQPLNTKNMGSIFKNNPLIPSWKIIDALNMRGFQIGNAIVSSKHTNFIINLGDATSSDILNIIELIEKRSKLEFGIDMIKEITIV